MDTFFFFFNQAKCNSFHVEKHSQHYVSETLSVIRQFCTEGKEQNSSFFYRNLLQHVDLQTEKNWNPTRGFWNQIYTFVLTAFTYWKKENNKSTTEELYLSIQRYKTELNTRHVEQLKHDDAARTSPYCFHECWEREAAGGPGFRGKHGRACQGVGQERAYTTLSWEWGDGGGGGNFLQASLHFHSKGRRDASKN